MTNEKQFRFTLIVCTLDRASSLKRLLDSVEIQSRYPDEIIIVDGSSGSETLDMLNKHAYTNSKYFHVDDDNRGLTRQRNFGIDKSGAVDVICYLDDDIVLEKDYFNQLIKTYKEKPEAIAVGGWIRDDTEWKKVSNSYIPAKDEFMMAGFVRKLGQRNYLRKRLGLLSDQAPGYMPEFSHGLATSFLPPSGKSYPVEFFMGGVASYKKELFNKIKFSPYFEGYGLYEDMDFCLRASRLGQLFVNTAAQVQHLHEEGGRPDHYKYGRMVIRNGYHVWKLKYSSPTGSAIFKWNLVNILLIMIRLKNAILNRELGAWLEVKGRTKEYFNLFTNRKLKNRR